MKKVSYTKKISSEKSDITLNVEESFFWWFKKYFNSWFTLLEIIIWISIFSIVIVIWFQALWSIGVWKIKLMTRVNTEKQIYYFSEKFFEEIKKWWKIDYEEYFNRKLIWTDFSSGHYDKNSWFWNFWFNWIIWSSNYWSGFYYCRSWDWINMSSWTLNPTLWCFSGSTFNSYSTSIIWQPQRYLQYALQFVDYNSNFDDDLWDENWDWNIIWDDDDEYLWEWPVVFTWWTDIKELYLISWDKTKRTIFRWNVKRDADAPPTSTCSIDSSNVITWTWCIWTVEYLKLEWRDWWINHDFLIPSQWQFDWVIDTWIISKNFLWLTDDIVAGSNSVDNYWVPLFPDTINVSDFKIFPYPNKDLDLSWKDYSEEINTSAYARIQLSILPSWKLKKKITWNPKELKFSTTITLTNVFSR